MDNTNPINTKGAQAGTKVKGMLVNVTASIIETAIPENSSHCMIADAIKAAAINKKMRIGKVLVDLATIRFTDRDTGRRYTCLTPQIGQQAIVKFDRGEKPEPFAFRLKPTLITEKAHRDRTNVHKGKPYIATNKEGSAPVVIGPHKPIASIGLRRQFGVRRLGLSPE
jgi:hypothetical protein